MSICVWSLRDYSVEGIKVVFLSVGYGRASLVGWESGGVGMKGVQ